MRTSKLLFVDLDKTLIKSDLLYEALIYLVKTHFFSLFLLPFYLFKGKAFFKHKVCALLSLNAETLPYNKSVLEYIKKEKENGKKIILATASNECLANPIAESVKVFDDVISSNKEINLKGKNKLNRIKEYVKENNEETFSYIGDSESDVQIFAECETPVVVGNKNVFEKVKEKNQNAKYIEESSKLTFKRFLKMIRVHQWAKNTLIFVPIILAHKIFDFKLLLDGITAFFSFSFLASFVYIINDIADLDADREHPTKKHRCFASGEVFIGTGLKIAFVLLLLSFVISIRLGQEFISILLLYFIITNLYSFLLKKLVIIDVITLSFLYTIRVIAGGYPFNIYLSPWLFMFSFFIFFSLACAKRYSELYAVKNHLQSKINGRGYRANDLEQMQIFGSASGYLAILIFALYVHLGIPERLYKSTQTLWLLCPVLLYWISRIWLFSHRGEMTQDPLVFALKDKASYVVLILGIIIFGVAKYV